MCGKVDVEFSDNQIEIIKRISTGELKLKDMEAVASLVSGIEGNSSAKKGAVSGQILEAIGDDDFNPKLIKDWLEERRDHLETNLSQRQTDLFPFIEKMVNILGENYCTVDLGKHFENAMECKNLLTLDEENPVFKMFMRYYSRDLKGAAKYYQKLLDLHEGDIVGDVFDHAFMSLKDFKIYLALKIATYDLGDNQKAKEGSK